jgi:anti-sigma regulatory factor (Ser/Thr protein kinase)
MEGEPYRMVKEFPRDISSLENIFVFVEQFISSNHIEVSVLYPVQLVVEELFTNILKYQRGGGSNISLDLEKVDKKFVMRMKDFDSEEFDMTKSGEVNTDAYIQQKKPGGLGIHLVKQMVDSIEYEYNNRISTITIIKHLER